MNKIVVDASSGGERLDVLLAKALTPPSRSFAQYLCAQNRVWYNDKSAKPGQKTKTGDTITFDAILPKHPPLKLPIIYEDSDCLVINKPSGVLTHSKGDFYPEPTVASFIQPSLKNLVGERAGIVHRLDRGTSGLIICAKHKKALKFLQKQFYDRHVLKLYIAIVNGKLTPPEAIIDMPIKRNPKQPQTFHVDAGGKSAQTHYKTLKIFKKGREEYSLVELKPLTGRTHQLRVHLSYQKHPIVGDSVYGGGEGTRLMLHATSLELTLPSKEHKQFTSQFPKSFNDFIK